jgi:hypothetical protein
LAVICLLPLSPLYEVFGQFGPFAVNCRSRCIGLVTRSTTQPPVDSKGRDLARLHVRPLAPGWVQPASETSLWGRSAGHAECCVGVGRRGARKSSFIHSLLHAQHKAIQAKRPHLPHSPSQTPGCCRQLPPPSPVTIPVVLSVNRLMHSRPHTPLHSSPAAMPVACDTDT